MDTVKKYHLNDQGFIAYDVTPGQSYKYVLHESKEWVEKAQQIQGPDWYYSKHSDSIEYKFDSFGFRNDVELEEVSANKDWWLIESGCSGMGPGIHHHETWHQVISDIAGVPVYSMSLFTTSPEFTNYNLVEMSKRWINPPTRMFTFLKENCNQTFKIVEDNRIVNIDHTNQILRPNDPEYAWYRELEESEILSSGNKLDFYTTIKLCESFGIELSIMNKSMVYEKDSEGIGGVGFEFQMLRNLFMDDDLIQPRLIPQGSPYTGLKEQPFEERQQHTIERIIEPIMYCQPPKGFTRDDVGRDMIHPSPKSHQGLAEKIAHHFNLSAY